MDCNVVFFFQMTDDNDDETNHNSSLPIFDRNQCTWDHKLYIDDKLLIDIFLSFQRTYFSLDKCCEKK